MGFWALSIQQKFRFEIAEISRAQWNGTFRWHRPHPSHHAFGYCSCKQDTTERYWGQRFCPIKWDISVLPTKITEPVKKDHLQSWSRTFRSDQIEMVRSIWSTTEISEILGWMENALCVPYLLSFNTQHPPPPPPTVFISGCKLCVVTQVIFFFTFQFIPSNYSKRFCQTPFKISFIVNLPRMFKCPKRQCVPNIYFFTHVQKNSPTRPNCLLTGRFAASSSRFVAIDFLHKTVLKKLRMNYQRVILTS